MFDCGCHNNDTSDAPNMAFFVHSPKKPTTTQKNSGGFKNLFPTLLQILKESLLNPLKVNPQKRNVKIPLLSPPPPKKGKRGGNVPYSTLGHLFVFAFNSWTQVYTSAFFIKAGVHMKMSGKSDFLFSLELASSTIGLHNGKSCFGVLNVN